MGRVLSMHLPLPAARSPYKTDSDISPPQKTTSCAHLLSWVVVVLGSSSLWLRLLRAVECWLAVVSKADADTPSLRGAILGAEGESDLTAGPVAPVNKELWVRGSSQRTVQWQGSAKVHPEELGGLGRVSVLPTSSTLVTVALCSVSRFAPIPPHRVNGSAKSFKPCQ